MSMQRILIISIVANLVCLAGLVWAFTQTTPTEPALGQATAASVATTPSQRQKLRVTERVVRETEPFHWSQIEADDYHTYVENLRRIGCPEETIRDLVKQDLDKMYDLSLIHI